MKQADLMTKIRLIPNVCAALFMVLVISACGPLVEFPGADEGADRVFDLRYQAITTSTEKSDARSLFLAEPIIAAGLKGSDIAVRPNDYELLYLPGARWSDRLSRMNNRFYQRGLSDQLSLTVLSGQDVDLAQNFRLRLSFDDFAIRTNNRNDFDQVVVSVTATLIDNTSNAIKGQRRFAETVSLNSQTHDAAVQGFVEANHSILKDMAAWANDLLVGH